MPHRNWEAIRSKWKTDKNFENSGWVRWRVQASNRNFPIHKQEEKVETFDLNKGDLFDRYSFESFNKSSSGSQSESSSEDLDEGMNLDKIPNLTFPIDVIENMRDKSKVTEKLLIQFFHL